MMITEEQWKGLQQWCRDHPIEHKVIMTTLPQRSPPRVTMPSTDGLYPDFPRLKFVTIKERKSKPEDSKYVFDPNYLQKLWEENNADNKE